MLRYGNAVTFCYAWTKIYVLNGLKSSEDMKKNVANVANVAILGVRVQALRKAKGLTRKVLCERAGVSPAFLYDLEHGLLKNPSLAHTEAVAVELGTDLATLLTMSREESAGEVLLRFSTPEGVALEPVDIAKAQRIMQEVFNAFAREGKTKGRRGSGDGREESSG